MGGRYANVFEAFHNTGSEHAHSDSSGTKTFHDTLGATVSISPTEEMKLFDGANNEIGVYKSSNWQLTRLEDITTFSELSYLMTNHNGFQFKLKAVLGEDFDSNTYNTFFAHSVDDFLTATHSFKDGAEIHATNSYILALQEDENERLLRLNDKYRNNVLTTKQMYMMVNRDSHKIRSNIRIIMYAILLAAVLMALMPSHQTTWAKILMALAIVLFFLFAVLHVRRNNSRRFTDFGKFFFEKGDVADGTGKEGSSTITEEEAEGEGECHE